MNKDQLSLLPQSPEELINSGSLVRVVNEAIEKMNINSLIKDIAIQNSLNYNYKVS